MAILLLGANHDTAAVAVRECLSIPPERIIDTLRFLRPVTGEVALISTCNRTEFYTASVDAERTIRDFIYRHSGISPGELDHALYRLEGVDAVRHLMRVACGLDSMVIGEPQVLGQVRDALQISRSAGACGPVLDALFRSALNAGKSARARTGISRGAVSVSHAAVELARERMGTLAGRSVLVIGAGGTGELLARNLYSNGATKISVANRTIERAELVARQVCGSALGLDGLDSALGHADIVICSTAAPQPLLTRDLLAPVVDRRQERPLLVIDIAVPRDSEPEIGELQGVIHRDLDDLQARMAANVAGRQEAAAEIEELIDEQVEAFRGWLAGHEAGPTIKALCDQADEIRASQLERLLRRMPDLDERGREQLRIFSEQLVNAMLHKPLSRLRDPELGTSNADAARRLFGLGAPASSEQGAGDSEDDDTPRSVA